MSKPFKCKNCDAMLEWGAEYKEGDRPLELNTGEIHNCAGLKKNSGGKYASAKFPIADYASIYDHAEKLLGNFYEKRKELGKKLPIEDEAIFIESMFRTLSQNFKP